MIAGSAHSHGGVRHVCGLAGRSCSWLWDRVATAALLSGWLLGASWQQGLLCMPGIGGNLLASESPVQSGALAGVRLSACSCLLLKPSVRCPCLLFMTNMLDACADSA